jgi:hypothetical protein
VTRACVTLAALALAACSNEFSSNHELSMSTGDTGPDALKAPIVSASDAQANTADGKRHDVLAPAALADADANADADEDAGADTDSGIDAAPDAQRDPGAESGDAAHDAGTPPMVCERLFCSGKYEGFIDSADFLLPATVSGTVWHRTDIGDDGGPDLVVLDGALSGEAETALGPLPMGAAFDGSLDCGTRGLSATLSGDYAGEMVATFDVPTMKFHGTWEATSGAYHGSGTWWSYCTR